MIKASLPVTKSLYAPNLGLVLEFGHLQMVNDKCANGINSLVHSSGEAYVQLEIPMRRTIVCVTSSSTALIIFT